MDCLYSLLLQIHPNLKKDELVISGGISNKIKSIIYDSNVIDTVESRGFKDEIDLMKRIDIPYEELQFNDLINIKNFKNIMILTPLTFIKNYAKLNFNVRQLSFFYSAFCIDNISHNKVSLSLSNGEKYSIDLDDLKRISEMSICPLSKPIYIFNFKNNTFSIKKDVLFNSVNECLTEFIESKIITYPTFKHYTGKNFYNKFVDIVEDYSSNFEQSNKQQFLKRQIFISSISVGTIDLYRSDFINCLFRYFNLSDDNLYKKLKMCSNAWREIGRMLRKFQNTTQSIERNDFKIIKNIVSDLKELELSAIEKTLEYLRNSYAI